ncbi:MAG: hypothetical protein EA395_10385 [Phormidium sp. GEM2.Bin31]|nr:MAG: hypothetical protein EA395_10385 [Phormidium sp. GEM2.Bin31]
MSIKSCPCCGKSMLEHIRMGQLYWFCNSCSFEMPIRSFSGQGSPVAARSSATVANTIGETLM